MAPYKLITGTDTNITEFEEKISQALLEGYDLANDLVVQLRALANGTTETILFQSMICDEALDIEDDEDDEDYDDEEEVDEFEEQESEFS